MDEVTWTALTAVLTAVGAAWTWYAFRHRGVASGLRGAGLTLLPPAAYLTGTLEMFTEIGTSVADWATSLVLSPVVWAGIVLAGLSVLLLGTSGAIRRRSAGAPASSGSGRETRASRKALPAGEQKGEPLLDDDLSDVEEILKRRGIT
ncbi:hypothetical protein [Nocardioides sp. GXQ0305]|uniref:hypothetical protein n=1 Tax=Nocardioides sp. GXQ0305 TaxID=3423912 RepID=UPI003D7CF4A4